MRRAVWSVVAALVVGVSTPALAARLFDDASSEYLKVSSALVTDYPWYGSLFFKAGNVTDNLSPLGIADEGSTSHFWVVTLAGGSGGVLRFLSANASANRAANTVNTYSAGQWHHAFIAANSASSRVSVLDGVWASRGESNATDSTPSGVDNVTIGGLFRSNGLTNAMAGDIAEVSIWKPASAYSSAEQQAMAEQLADGVSPLLVRRADLIHYWPLQGRDSPEPDLVGAQDMVLQGTPTFADHPRVIRPRRPY